MIENHRRKRLQEQIEWHGGQAKLADALDVSPGFISQLMTLRRPFTEKTARKFEDKLLLPNLWFDIDESNDYKNIAEVPNGYSVTKSFTVPLISWVRAGEFCEAADPLEPGVAEEWMHRPKGAGPRTYALRVKGDSMTSPYPGARSYPEGTIIFVDPDQEVTAGKRGIAKVQNSNEVTFKELVNDAGRLFLKPINPQYDKILVTEDMVMCGLVIGSYVPE